MAGHVCSTAESYLTRMGDLLGSLDRAAIDRYADLLMEVWLRDGCVFVFGNGGSASCASHHVADYVKTASVDGQRRLRAMSLVDNKEMLTAIGNDIGYDDIFLHQLESFAKAGDVAVAISCSGNSPNVVSACQWAKSVGIGTVAVTGFKGGELGSLADIHINIPDDNYGIVEDLQLAVGHMVAQRLHCRVIEHAASNNGRAQP